MNMEKITAFNEKINYIGRNLNWSYSFLQHIMEFVLVCYMFAMLDISMFKYNFGMIIFPMIFFFYAIYGRLGAVLYVKEKNQVAHTLKKLRYVPVDKELYIKVNMRILVKYMRKLILIFLVEQVVFGYLFFGKVSLWNIFFPLGLGVAGLLLGYVMIKGY